MASWKITVLGASRSYPWTRVMSLAAGCFAVAGAAAQDTAPDAAPDAGSAVSAPAVPETSAAPERDDDAARDSDAGSAAARATVAPPVDPATLASPLEAAIELDRLMAQERFAAALEAGARMVELTERDFGRAHRETAEAYARLADAQRRADRLDLAEESYHAAIDIYRDVDGAFTPLAIEPLTSLGDSYHDGREYLNAVSAYEEARTTTRRAYGLLAEGQVALLERMAESLLDLRRIDEANERQLEALRLVERRAEPGSEAWVDALFAYAAWLRRIYRFPQEREQYRHALDGIRERYGENDLRAVKPLMAIANSFREEGVLNPDGERKLNEALALLRSAEDPSALAVAEVLRDIGDWKTAFATSRISGDEYRRAWNLLGTVPNGNELRREWFGGTVRILRSALDYTDIEQTSDSVAGSVVVKFDIDESGRVTDAEVIESNPPGLKDEDILRHVLRSRFRPHLRDGELVPGPERAMRFTFPYIPSTETQLTQARG